MRLNKIKLAGFKSFVDPTSVSLPGNLIGVVGPNGCGKSNIIDAVRWVMGEISAKHLRGDSMADVVFNGSSSRKRAQRRAPHGRRWCIRAPSSCPRPKSARDPSSWCKAW